MKKRIILGAVALVGVALVSCSSHVKNPPYAGGENIGDQLPVAGDVPLRVELAQGWSSEIRNRFWFTSQGSRIMPYNWFTWLEQPNSEQLFRNTEHMEMLRYLPVDSSPSNPAGLPIGFVKDVDKKSNQSFVGMTCAACHTTQIDYKNTKMLVEGAPTIANFVLFFSRLVDAIEQTYSDDAKFGRFATNILGDTHTSEQAATLRMQLQTLAKQTADRQAVNSLPTGFPKDFTSYGRLDAFGNIQNAGTAFALNDLSNRNYPTGPVSYPFLWGTHQSDVVQWNASAPNTPVIGPLARNAGEVVGVFGELSMEESPWYAKLFGLEVQYRSSLDMKGLGKLESWVKTLKSPQWPIEHLPAIDMQKAAAGGIIYADQCASCHQVVKREDEGKHYIANRTPVDEIGTDPVTAWNASRHMAKSLILEGTKQDILFGDVFEAETAAISVPVNGVIGLVLENPAKALEAGLIPTRTKMRGVGDEGADTESSPEPKKSFKELVLEHIKARKELRKDKHPSKGKANDKTDLTALVYKGRPLNGIWATAPYLHNGSVASLWEIMQKPEDRSDSFWVGSREFDPVNVGYVTNEGLSEFKVNGSNNKVMPGNSNGGHLYGTSLTDAEKWQVVEYMKTL